MRSHPCGLSVRLSIFKERFEKQWRRCCRTPRKTCISSFIFTQTEESARPLDMKPHAFIRSSQALSRYVFIRVQILQTNVVKQKETGTLLLTLRLLISYIYIYIYGTPSKARNDNVVYIWTYVWPRWNSLFLFAAQCFNTESMQRGFLCHICV